MWDVSLTVSSFNMDHFSCLIFDHACFWSLGMEEISGVGIEYNVCQFGMFKINSKFKKGSWFFALQNWVELIWNHSYVSPYNYI